MSHHINTLEEAGQIGQPASHKKSSLNRLRESAVRNLAAMLPEPHQDSRLRPGTEPRRKPSNPRSPQPDRLDQTNPRAHRPKNPIASHINNLAANTPAPSSPSPSSPAPSKLEPPNLGLLSAPSAGRRCHPNSTPKGAVQHQKGKIRNEPKLDLKILNQCAASYTVATIENPRPHPPVQSRPITHPDQTPATVQTKNAKRT